MRLAYNEGYDGKYLTTDSSEEKFWLFAFAPFHGNPATADSELLNTQCGAGKRCTQLTV